MKADISTLHKPDILILRRQIGRRHCPEFCGVLASGRKEERTRDFSILLRPASRDPGGAALSFTNISPGAGPRLSFSSADLHPVTSLVTPARRTVMKIYPTKDIRNVGIVGHGGTGKTQLVSSLLYTAGATARFCQFWPRCSRRPSAAL